MSAVSGGGGLGTGVGRGRGVGTGPPFTVTAPTKRMRTANATLMKFLSVFSYFFLSSFFLRNLPSEVLEFLPESEKFSPARDCRGVQGARSLTNRHPSASIDYVSYGTSYEDFIHRAIVQPTLPYGMRPGFSAKAGYSALSHQSPALCR